MDTLIKYEVTDEKIAEMNDRLLKVTEEKELPKAIAEYRTARTSTDKMRKALNDKAQTWIKKVNGESKRIIALLVPGEEELKERKRKIEFAKAEIARKAQEAEENRIKEIQNRIKTIEKYFELSKECKDDLGALKINLQLVKTEIIDNTYQEFEGNAYNAKQGTISYIEELIADCVAREALRIEKAKLAAERAELDREKEELAKAKADRDAGDARKLFEENQKAIAEQKQKEIEIPKVIDDPARAAVKEESNTAKAIETIMSIRNEKPATRADPETKAPESPTEPHLDSFSQEENNQIEAWVSGYIQGVEDEENKNTLSVMEIGRLAVKYLRGE